MEEEEHVVEFFLDPLFDGRVILLCKRSVPMQLARDRVGGHAAPSSCAASLDTLYCEAENSCACS